MTESPQPIFQSTSQALHFSYLLEAYEPGAESAMGKIIGKRMEELGIANGERVESTIKFDGLNAMEVRGQAAMVRSCVASRLIKAEAWAIKAKFGITRVTERRGRPKAYSFSAERIDAMRNLAGFISPLYLAYQGVNERAVLWLIAMACVELKAARPSFRDIEELTGASKSQLCRVYPEVKRLLRSLEQRGVDGLTPLFKREGLVP